MISSSYRKLFSFGTFGLLFGGLINHMVSVPLPRPDALTHEQMQSIFGGLCPHHRCDDKICDCSYTSACALGPNNTCAAETAMNDFARCKDDPMAYSKCSETSGTNCGALRVGTPGMNNSCEGQCASDGGSCGQVRYTCTASSCE